MSGSSGMVEDVEDGGGCRGGWRLRRLWVMRLYDLVETSRRVAQASGRLEKVGLLAGLLRGVEPEEVQVAAAFLCGRLRQARLGVGYAGVRAAAPLAAAESPALTLSEVDATFGQIARAPGKGSVDEKLRLLSELLARATRDEQRFLVSLVVGEVRQGALEGLVAEAVAQAAGVPAGRVRRAVMAAGDLPSVAQVALAEGSAGLSRFAIQLFRPVLPMLAEAAEDAPDALAQLGRAALEFKLDGARVQVHKSGDEVRRRSADLLPPDERGDGGRARARRGDPGAPRPRPGLGRRGDRAPAGRGAPSVPNDDAPVRPQARGRAAPAGIAAHAVLLRHPVSGRRPPARRAPGAPLCGAQRACAGRAGHPPHRDRLGRSGAGVSRRGARARPRRDHGQGARRALRGRQPRPAVAQGEARADARSRGARRRMGPRTPPRLALESAPRRTRC